MAAAPREGAVAHGYGSAGPRPPAAMPGAPARGALSLRRPSPEPPPPPCSVPSRVGRGGLRRGRPAPGGGERRGGGGGLPVRRSKCRPAARSPTEAPTGSSSQRDCQLWRIKQGGTEKQLDEAREEPRGAACAGGATGGTGGTPPSERSLLRSAQPRGAGGTRRDLRVKVLSFSGY
ncbi:translation initiation factor IF-2-like [Aquila chrysaetos chrysaetos]|uniref:translation initiation factor IF-2-like n=1 Tax=Aquila chrysaetos chrysaetos TaxID=223781 RepID=UPI0011773192|nr:translation initiation factor IF-2-like [Aquila chrysaetos chrysaetos]